MEEIKKKCLAYFDWLKSVESTGMSSVFNQGSGALGEKIESRNYLTAVFFETGAMSTPTKSQNPTNCGWGGSFQSYLTHS